MSVRESRYKSLTENNCKAWLPFRTWLAGFFYCRHSTRDTLKVSFFCDFEIASSSQVWPRHICLNSDCFQAISHILIYRDQQMIEVVEGRSPLRWSYKQLGHLSTTCPQKSTINNNNNNIGKNHQPNHQSYPGTRGPPKQIERRMDPGYQKGEKSNPQQQ